jgi:4-amino-4-deoxychorismate lyase
MNAVLIDGQQVHSIACTDRGLQYGDGLFETISCREGRPRWLSLHVERLRSGLARLRLPFDAFDALQADIVALAAGQPHCLIKVIVTRGAATRRGYAPAGNEQPTRIVSRHDWPATNSSASGFRVGLSEVRLGVNPMLAGLKHLNRLEQVLAQQACVDSGLQEVLMLSATGQLIGGSMSNVFLADEQGLLLTPELRDCGVEGVMRRVVLEAAASSGIAIRVAPVAPCVLARVREAFVTNVRLEVQSVGWLDGRVLPSDDYARRLRRQIDATRC